MSTPVIPTDRCVACGWIGSWDGVVCPECGARTERALANAELAVSAVNSTRTVPTQAMSTIYGLFYSEGFGDRLVAIYTDENVARKTAKGTGWYGGDLEVRPIVANPESFQTPQGKVSTQR